MLLGILFSASRNSFSRIIISHSKICPLFGVETEQSFQSWSVSPLDDFVFSGNRFSLKLKIVSLNYVRLVNSFPFSKTFLILFCVARYFSRLRKNFEDFSQCSYQSHLLLILKPLIFLLLTFILSHFLHWIYPWLTGKFSVDSKYLSLFSKFWLFFSFS